MQQHLARDIAVEAYIYFYPLVLMETTRRQMTNADSPHGIIAPMGTFAHARAFPDASFRAVVRPNFDTLYSSAWLDLSKGPMIVTVPGSRGRYHLLPAYDMWTDAFAVPGSRTTGDDGGCFGFVAPGYRGELPDRITRVDAPTPTIWIIGRTQTNGPADYERVHAFQDGWRITPLSRWGKAAGKVKRLKDPAVDMETPPAKQVEEMSGRRFFEEAARLWKRQGPHSTDHSQVWRLRRIGLCQGRDLDFDRLDREVQELLTSAPVEAMARIRANVPRLGRIVNGWSVSTEDMGVYGVDYLRRASVALVGLGANQPADAVYPLLVEETRAGDRYVLHFDRGELPPVAAFWSVTLYDQDGFPVANPLDRYALGDRDPLIYNADGSLDIHVQHDSPGAERERNWLPAPMGDGWNLTMRLYAPLPSVLDGTWSPPALRRARRAPAAS